MNPEAGHRFGDVTELAIDESYCEAGGATYVGGLPWDVTYAEAVPEQGSLPRAIEALYLIVEAASVHLPAFGGAVNCYYGSEPGMMLETSSADGEEAAAYLTGLLIFDESVQLPVDGSESSGARPEEVALAGTLDLEQQRLYSP